MWITKIRFFDWNCERPHTSCPTGLFTRLWQPYARSRGGRLPRLTWGGTRRFIGRLLTGCALARYPASEQCSPFQDHDRDVLSSKRRRQSDPTEASAQPGAGSCPYHSAAYRQRAKSLQPIAAGLEERGIPAARGGKWSAVQVARLLEAAGSPFDGASVAG
jgi:hypothetical protein